MFIKGCEIMAQIAFVFPGQGSQFPGMGHEFYKNNPSAKAVFESLEAIRPGLLNLCFEGSKEELSETINTQACLYACQSATLAALIEMGIKPDVLAGFSLGEITALAASGIVSVEDGFRIVLKRAEFMQADAEAEDTAMLAVLRIDADAVEAICASIEGAYPVNFNSPRQTVVAAKRTKIDDVKDAVLAKGGRVIPLAVNAGFHSPFMDRAAQRFGEALEEFDLKEAIIPLISNFSGELYKGDYVRLLSNQINHPVRWEAIVNKLAGQGVNTFIEVGPGKVLSGLIQKINPQLTTYQTDTYSSLGELAEVSHA